MIAETRHWLQRHYRVSSHCVRSGTPRIASFGRTLATLDELLGGARTDSVTATAKRLGLPVATVHRQVATLVAEGCLVRTAEGRHVAGPRLRRLLQHVDRAAIVACVAAPLLHRLAARVRSVVQLGTYENEMVTYRIKTGRGAGELFTRVGMQLEAYCSGIGKVLLASLPGDEREAYLASGPFVALTDRTLTDADALRRELDMVREQGFALDREEVAVGLSCIAVPVHSDDGEVCAAISMSRTEGQVRRIGQPEALGLLREVAAEIERKVSFPAPASNVGRRSAIGSPIT